MVVLCYVCIVLRCNNIVNHTVLRSAVVLRDTIILSSLTVCFSNATAQVGASSMRHMSQF